MSPHWSIDDTPTSPNGPGAVPDADLSSYERVAILLGQADLGLVRALAELARYDAAGLVELLAEVPTDIVPAQTVVGDVKERATKPSEPAGMSEAERIKADHDALRWDKNGFRISKKPPSTFQRNRPEPKHGSHWSS